MTGYTRSGITLTLCALVIGLLVGTAITALPSQARAPAVTGAPSHELPAAPASPTPPPIQLRQVEELSSHLSASARASIGQILATAAEGKVAKATQMAEGFLNPSFSFPSIPQWGSIFLGTGAIFSTIGAVCALTGPESLGTTCLGAIVVGALFLVVGYFLVTYQGSPPALAAHAAYGIAANQLESQGFLLSVAYNQSQYALNVWNSTYNFLAYQASSGALLQLGNSSFNAPLDLSQSPVAQELAGSFQQMIQPVNIGIAQLASWFNLQEGTLDSLGYYCPLELSMFNLTAPASPTLIDFPGPTGSVSCPATTPSPVHVPSAKVQMQPSIPAGYESTGAPSAACPEVFLAENVAGSTAARALVWGNFSFSGTLEVDLYPVADSFTGGGPYPGEQVLKANSSTAKWFDVPLGVQSGGYYVCSPNIGVGHLTTQGINLQVGEMLPLNSFSMTATNNMSSTLTYEATNSSEVPQGSLWGRQEFPGTTAIGIINGGNCALNFTNGKFGCGTSFGPSTRESNVFFTEGRSLQNLTTVAASTAQAYWSFLRGLGYTSLSQVPSNCIIPNPAQVLPPNMNVSRIASLNVSQILTVYYAYLSEIGSIYNATTNLSTVNFCGHHVSSNLGAGLVSWGVYAYGYVFNPHSTKNSAGTATQVFSTPSTWNYSGVIYLNPSIANESVPVGQTWELGEANPTVVFDQPFFTGNLYNNSTRLVLNTTGPSWCVHHTTGCSLVSFDYRVTGLVIGNSSSKGGSAYPNSLDPTAGSGYAVYLTACYGNTSTGYSRINGTCPFSLTTVNTALTKTTCGQTINGTCASSPTGGILGGSSLMCSSGIPLWSALVNGIATAISGWPFIGAFACGIADVIGAIFVIFGVAVVAAVAGWAYRTTRRN